MFEVEQLFEQVSRLKKCKACVTNNFLSVHDMTRISKEENSRLLYNDNLALIMNEDNGVTRLHFYLASLYVAAELITLIQPFRDRPFIVDCIGKTQYVEEIAKVLCETGFNFYTKLSRWKSKSISFFSYPHFIDAPFRTAVKEDSGQILRILNDVFDPYIAHLPTKERLLTLIEDQSVFCAMDNGEIVATVCLEKLGRKTIYSYLDAVIEKYRSKGIGILLLQFAMYQFRDCTNYIAWSEDKNTASNRMHRAFGMSYDGLKDYVLIYE